MWLILTQNPKQICIRKFQVINLYKKKYNLYIPKSNTENAGCIKYKPVNLQFHFLAN